jgi:hypothetical protein
MKAGATLYKTAEFDMKQQRINKSIEVGDRLTYDKRTNLPQQLTFTIWLVSRFQN